MQPSDRSYFARPVLRILRRLVVSKGLWPLSVVLAFTLVGFLLTCISSIGSPRDLTIPEGSVVYAVEAVLHGECPYRDFREMPYATTPYPPVYYLIVAGLASLGRTQGVDGIYLSGRLSTLLATLCCVFFTARLARRAGASRSWATIAALMVFTNPCLIPWTYTCRPDMTALAFSLAGLDWYFSHSKGVGTGGASALFVAAFFTKQSFLSAPLALVLGCLTKGSLKAAALLVTCCTVLSAIIWCLSDWFTGGLFYLNIVQGNATSLIWFHLGTAVQRFLLFECAGPLIFAVFGLTRLRRRSSLAQISLSYYAGIAVCLALAASLKAGADHNYFLEPLFALAVVAGRGLPQVEHLARHYLSCRVVVVLGSLLLAGPVVLKLYFETTRVGNAPSPQQVLERLDSIHGDILFGDAGLAVRSGRPVLLLDKFNASYLGDAGKIDFSDLVGRLERQEVAAVVLDQRSPFHDAWGQPWWPRKVAHAIDEYYTFKNKVYDKFLFLPGKPDRSNGRKMQTGSKSALEKRGRHD